MEASPTLTEKTEKVGCRAEPRPNQALCISGFWRCDQDDPVATKLPHDEVSQIVRQPEPAVWVESLGGSIELIDLMVVGEVGNDVRYHLLDSRNVRIGCVWCGCHYMSVLP